MPLKVMEISPAGIVHRDIGWVEGKRIPDIGILRTVIAAHLPAERDGFRLPLTARSVIRQIKQVLQIMDRRIPGKIPVTAAQHLKTVGAFPVPGRHVAVSGRRDIIGPVRHGVLVQNREVLIESWNDQNITPFPVRE